jgi:hypothetical protein
MSNRVGRDLRAGPMALEGSKSQRKLKFEIDGERLEIDLWSDWIDPKARASFFWIFCVSLLAACNPWGFKSEKPRRNRSA